MLKCHYNRKTREVHMNKLWKRILAMTLVFGLTASSICFKTENDAAWAAEPDLTDGLVGCRLDRKSVV